MKNKKHLKRRDFLKNSALTLSAFTILPSHVIGGLGHTMPSDKLNLGCIGIGGKGRVDIAGVSSENIVALCDVDQARASDRHGFSQNAYEAFPDARRYEDFRDMFEKENDLDGVTICTPDHVHAVATTMAMKKGINVYTQKPLTHTIDESRRVVSLANKTGVVTQMGIQNHANEGPRILNELVWEGVIGEVKEVYCWTDRPVWPQGIEYRPIRERIPYSLSWDLWLGPAPYRAYNQAYVPFDWRGWWDFGEGALGDMGCHLIDYANWALKFGSLLSVEAYSTQAYSESAPLSAIVTYYLHSELTGSQVKLVWYDGGLKPNIPLGLKDEATLNLWQKGSGVILKGDSGTLVYGHKHPKPILIVNKEEKNYTLPKQKIPRSPGFYKEWINAIKGNKEIPTADFNYSGPLTEIVLLGVIAIRTGKKLFWDNNEMEITNVRDANIYLQNKYRKGWEL